ncbi:MAG TPA: CBS domain-containing protein, partial [Egibacteraceae bacterium]
RITADLERLDEVFKRDIVALLVAATGSPVEPPAGDGSFAMQLTAHAAGREISKRVRASVGAARRVGTRTVIPLHWHAEPGRHVFPSFDGAVELEPLDVRPGPRSRAEVSIIGSYKAPLGPLGVVGDAAGLHHIAEQTVARLVDALAPELERAARGEAPPAVVPTPLLTVRDVMTPDPVTFDVDMPLKTAALVLLHRGISGAPVVDHDGGLVGVLSERDLLDREAGPRYGLGREARRAEQHRQARTVGDACTRPAITTSPDTTLRDAADLMARHDVARLVVLDGAVVAGIITRHDVLLALTRSDEEIRDAVEAVLAELDELGVAVTVDLGEVTLTGHASLRSAIPGIVGRIQEVDGVAGVDAEQLAWDVDDVGLPPLLPV